MYTDEQLEEYQFSVEYAEWLCQNGMDYGVIICNGEDFLKTLEK